MMEYIDLLIEILGVILVAIGLSGIIIIWKSSYSNIFPDAFFSGILFGVFLLVTMIVTCTCAYYVI